MAIDLDYTPAGTDDSAVAGSSTGIDFVKATGSAATLKHRRTGDPIQGLADWEFDGNTFGGVEATWPAAAAANGLSWPLRTPPLGGTGVLFIGTWFGPTGRVGDVALNLATGSVRCRDFNTLRQESPAGLVVEGQDVLYEVACTPGSATGHRVRVFVGANIYGATPDWESEAFSATLGSQTTLTRAVLGQAPSGTTAVKLRGGRIRHANTAAYPGSGYTGLPAARTVTAVAGAGQVALSWTAAGQQTGLTVYRSTSRGGPYTALTDQPSATAAAFTDTSAVNGTAYFYVVRVRTTAGTSPRSAPVSATPKASTSQTLYPKADVTVAAARAVNAAGATLASALSEKTPDDTSYTAVELDGKLEFEMEAPVLPLDAKTEMRVPYGVPSGFKLGVRIGVYDGTTLIAQTDLKTSPGNYSRKLTDAEFALVGAAWAAGRKVTVVQTSEEIPAYGVEG